MTTGCHDDAVDDVMVTMTTEDALLFCCELVVQAQQPLTSLNPSIEQFIHEISSGHR